MQIPKDSDYLESFILPVLTLFMNFYKHSMTMTHAVVHFYKKINLPFIIQAIWHINSTRRKLIILKSMQSLCKVDQAACIPSPAFYSLRHRHYNKVFYIKINRASLNVRVVDR